MVEIFMLNTDIFNFEFVDRTEERIVIDEFLSDNSNNNYVIWLHGGRGTGKSFFLTEYVMSKRDYTCVYVNVEIDNATPGDYLKKIIGQLNQAANLKFISYIRANYKSIGTIGEKALSSLLNIADLDEFGLDELCSSITNYFISRQGDKENTVSVVKKYVREAQKKCKNIVFLLDNFSQCDKASLDIIVSVIHDLLQNEHIKFIICTTDEDLEKRFDIQQIIAEKIPNKPLIVYPFQEKQLFIRMLETTFELDSTTIQLLARVFDLCNGVPQTFKEILINLYTKQGIIIEDTKAKFAIDIFNQQLLKKVLGIDLAAICKSYSGAKTILEILGYWGRPISTAILFDFLDYIADIEPLTPVKEELNKTIHILQNLHIITKYYEDNMILLGFEHDSLKIAVEKYFQEDRVVPFLYYSIYEYIKTHEGCNSSPYWERFYQPLLAFHSYKAQAEGWIECNYSYGYGFFESHRFGEAESIFSRLENIVCDLSEKQLLIIGITFFYCGQYRKADDIFTYLQKRDFENVLSMQECVKLFVFQARARSCLLDSRGALDAIASAEELSISEENLRLQILGAKQSILFLSPGGFDEAKALFDSIIEQKLEIKEMALIYQSAMDYYEGKESLKYLDKGLTIAQKFSDDITEGKIQNNIGFELVRSGEYNDARLHFQNSISILKECQPHEQVYSFSNLSVLEMILGNWDCALDYILEALFWNKSEYASLVLKTNRMLCYYYLGNDQWEEIYHELYKYVNLGYTVDDKIYKKICINLAILAMKRNWNDECIKILELCKPHLKLEWPHGKYRFIKIYNEINGENTLAVLPQNSCQIQYYCQIEFEPWLVNFSHD